MRSDGRWWWPGLRSLLRCLRFAFVTFGLGIVLGLLGTGVDALRPLTDRWPALALAAVAAAGALGTRHGIHRSLFARISRTHGELHGANSPIELIYGLAIGTAAFILAQRLAIGLDPSEAIVTAGQSLFVVVAVVAAYGVAGMVSNLWPERKDDFERVQAGAIETIRFRDLPITDPSQDLLSRPSISRQLLDSCIGFRDQSLTVIALEGRVGAGKSTVVGLTRRLMADLGVLSAQFSAMEVTSGRLNAVVRSKIQGAVRARYAVIDVRGAISTHYRFLRPVAGVASVALPEFPETRPAFGSLGDTLSRIKPPIVVFVEDVDSLRGPEVLDLIAGLATLELPNGFVFVLVYDRARVMSSLATNVSDANAYLRASIRGVVLVPDPPADTLLREIDRMIDEVADQHDLKVAPPKDASPLLPSDWRALFPTLRDAKHLADTFADRLSTLAGEVSPWDLLLATALDLVAPQVLSEVNENPSLWLVNLPANDALRAAFNQTPDAEKSTQRDQRLAELVGDARQRRPVTAIVANLFPQNPDPGRAKADSRMVDHGYFQKYRERRVAPTVAPDVEIAALVARVNAAEGPEAHRIFVEGVLASTTRLDLLSKLVLRAEAFAPEVRRPVVLGCAALSDRLSDQHPFFDFDEFDRARALVFSLLELGRDDVYWQESTIYSAIRASSALEFARGLLIFSTPERNRILSRFEAFDQAKLAQVFIETLISLLAAGYSPFVSEPRTAPFILGRLGDPVKAAEWALKFDAIDAVLKGHLAATFDDTPGAVVFEDVSKEYDLAVLKRGLPTDRPLTAAESQLANLVLIPKPKRRRPTKPSEGAA